MSAPKRILCVDRDPQQAGQVRELLAGSRLGPFEVDAVESVADGMKRLATGKYALCLLAHGRGDRGGFELLLEARHAQTETPVIMLARDDDEEAEIAAIDAGVADFVPKAELTPRVMERSIRYALKMGDTTRRLRQMALHDELTGLFNRREMHRLLAEEWHRSTRFDHPFALVLVDIDHFKRVNDTHGHRIGDRVLCHVAHLLAGQLRLVDRLSRFGGEEFAIIMPETKREEAVVTIERLRVLLEENPAFVEENNLTLPVTFSAGVAVSPADAADPDTLIERADQALYAAKHEGRNRVKSAG